MTADTEREEMIAKTVSDFPAAPWYLRIWGVRHYRAWRATRQINRHYQFWGQIGALPVNADCDYAIRDAIWRGEK